MAIFKPGPIVQAISGTVAGSNFVASTRSIYVRKSKRSTPNNSPTQLDRQTSMTMLARTWNSFTDAQRGAWNVAAAAYATKNKLGIPIKLNGREFFFATLLRSLSEPTQPVNYTPPVMVNSPTPTNFSVTNPASGQIILHATEVAPTIGAPQYFIYSYENLTGPTRRTWNRWTILRGIRFSTINNLDIYPMYIVRFPPPQLGQTFIVKVIRRDFGGAPGLYWLDANPIQATCTITNP